MKIKACTFNIRMATERDGINEFKYRTGRILDVIVKEKPDIIGFQEVMESGRELFQKELTDYVVLGCGRYKNYDGEGVSLAFRKDRFMLLSYENFWLSDYPEESESFFSADQSINPREAQIAVLVTEKGEKILFANTHLDDLGKTARLLGADRLVSKIGTYGDLPTVVTGDMNAVYGDPEIDRFLKWKKGRLQDMTKDSGGTFHGYGKCTAPYKIDYIFSTGTPTAPGYCAEDIPVEGVYISDHYPVFAEIEL